MLNCSIWLSAQNFWMGGGLESSCVGRVNGADSAVHPSKNSVQKTICCNSTSNAPDDWRMYPKHVELRIYQLHQAGFLHYFMRKMHVQTKLKFVEGRLNCREGRGTDGQKVRDFNVRCFG